MEKESHVVALKTSLPGGFAYEEKSWNVIDCDELGFWKTNFQGSLKYLNMVSCPVALLTST